MILDYQRDRSAQKRRPAPVLIVEYDVEVGGNRREITRLLCFFWHAALPAFGIFCVTPTSRLEVTFREFVYYKMDFFFKIYRREALDNDEQ